MYFIPIYTKHRKIVKEPVKFYCMAFGAGLIATFIAGVIEILIKLLLNRAGTSGIIYEIFFILYVFIGVAGVEEIVKFYAGRSIARKVPRLTESGSIIIFGFAGIACGFFELLGLSDIYIGIFRGLLPLHFLLQMWMEKNWFTAQKAKGAGDEKQYKKHIKRALIFPIISHGLFDYPLLKAAALHKAEKISSFDSLSIMLISAIVGVVTAVIIIRSVVKALKAEKSIMENPDRDIVME